MRAVRGKINQLTQGRRGDQISGARGCQTQLRYRCSLRTIVAENIVDASITERNNSVKEKD
jgi:hypothetical protein